MASSVRKVTTSGKFINEEPHIVNSDGEYLFCKYWKPEEPPRCLICVLHGYGEHCSRYSELASHLNKLGAYVFAHDCKGHGESEGEGWYLSDYNVLVRDALQHIDTVRDQFPELPIFVFGHSLGGNVAILAAYERPQLFKGVILSAADILEHRSSATPFSLFLLRVVIRVFPRLKNWKLPPGWLTRDEDEIAATERDPLQADHGIMAQTAQAVLAMSEYVRSILDQIEFPFLVTHGDGDMICDVEGAKLLHKKAKSEDKTIKIYPGLYHNLEHELKDDRLVHFNVITDWIKERI